MPKQIDISGNTYGELTAINRAPNRGKNTYWVCKCNCGIQKEIAFSSLRSGASKSCGCLRKQLLTTHGETKSKLYAVWNSMKSRCNNDKDPYYTSYGGRGIVITSEWEMDFPGFRAWALSNGYQEGLTLDRRNNDGNYFPLNCRWVSKTVQARNQRKQQNTTSIYRGVSWDKSINKWKVQNHHDKKTHYIGHFIDEIDAAKARDQYIINNKLSHFILNF